MPGNRFTSSPLEPGALRLSSQGSFDPSDVDPCFCTVQDVQLHSLARKGVKDQCLQAVTRAIRARGAARELERHAHFASRTMA